MQLHNYSNTIITAQHRLEHKSMTMFNFTLSSASFPQYHGFTKSLSWPVQRPEHFLCLELDCECCGHMETWFDSILCTGFFLCVPAVSRDWQHAGPPGLGFVNKAFSLCRPFITQQHNSPPWSPCSFILALGDRCFFICWRITVLCLSNLQD